MGDSRERTADGEPIPLFMSNVYNIVDGRGNGIVGWGEDGDTFIVHDAQAFSREILPQHFRHSNFSSFVRQVGPLAPPRAAPARCMRSAGGLTLAVRS